MRLFIGLDIDAEIREHIQTFIEGLRGFSPDARWVSPESLHITLKFIGETQPQAVDAIKFALSGVEAKATEITFAGTGFFPTVKSPRVFWIGIEADEKLAPLAAAVDAALEPLGIAKEERAFSPHLTLARTGSGRPQRMPEDRANVKFKRLRERLAAMPPPSFGTMTAREFFLYESKLSPAGARYSKLERFPLRSE